MKIWSYDETVCYVHENFTQSLGLGLNVLQATERALYEFEAVIEAAEQEKFMIYIVLAKLGIEHNLLRSDIKDEFFFLLNEMDKKIDHVLEVPCLHCDIAFIQHRVGDPR